MQSRFAAAAVRSNWVVAISHGEAFRRGLASSSRTADPSVHAVDHENDPAIFSGEPEKSQDATEPEYPTKSNEDSQIKENPDEDEARLYNLARPGERTEPFAHPKSARAPSSKLESTGVKQPLDPIIQQKRKQTTAIPDASCAGLDGTPLAKEEEERIAGRRENDERDYKEYYKYRKPSPLAEIEVADTRKPITQATDGTAESEEYGGGKDGVGWRVEQLETAEETLLRAGEIWKRNAARGEPDAPQSRILRELRGETW